MTDVSKQLRAKLAEVAEIVLPEIVTVQTSSDGTEKLLLRLRDGALVETVILPSTGQDGSVRIASACLRKSAARWAARFAARARWALSAT